MVWLVTVMFATAVSLLRQVGLELDTSCVLVFVSILGVVSIQEAIPLFVD